MLVKVNYSLFQVQIQTYRFAQGALKILTYKVDMFLRKLAKNHEAVGGILRKRTKHDSDNSHI